jgi:very-short-patch-repair endonuclease
MRNKPLDRAVADLAAKQHGVVSAAQLREAGLSRQAITRRVQAGRLHRLHRGVYAVGHVALGWEGRCFAAILACGEGAVVSHQSAAVLWGLLPGASLPVDVTVRRDGGRPDRPGISLHTSINLSPDSVTRSEGIPLTRPARTLRDLRRVGPHPVYLRAARRAIDKQLIEATAPAAEELTRSELERRFLALCRRHRLPAPEVNARIGRFEVDFLWRGQRVIGETDGFEFHRERRAFEEDRARDVELQALGYRVLRFTYRAVRDESGKVAATLRRVLTARPPAKEAKR